MKLYKIFVLTLIIAFSFFPWNLSAYCGTKECRFEKMNEIYEKVDFRVLRVIDGDTILIDYFGIPKQVRLLGIDTPETRNSFKPVECFANQATIYTKKLVGDKKIKLKMDPLNEDIDQFGRLLRYVILENGTNLSYLLVSEGYAKVFREYPSSLMDNLVKIEKIAKVRQKKLWSGKCDLFPTFIF